MNELLYHAERCEDKANSKSIISRFDLIKIEDLTKLSSVLKSVCQWDTKRDGADNKDEGAKQLKFEDIYDL